MSKAARRLGRGLESLVSNLREDPGPPSVAPMKRPGEAPTPAYEPTPQPAPLSSAPHGPSTLPVDKLVPNPFQPRQDIDEATLEPLVKSIRRSGILQPISVRKHADQYQIIAGERRWRAARLSGITSVPVVVRSATDEQMLELALVENLQREDLNAIDRAKAYRQFCRAFSLTAEEVAERLGEDRSTVANYIRLLELEESLQAQVAAGTLTMGHARALLGVRDPHERHRLAQAVEHNQLSVRALEEIIRRRKTPDTTSPQPEKAAAQRTPHLRDLQTRFEHSLKTKVTIHEGRKKGSGRITIEYYNIDDFDRIAAMLGIRLD